LIGLTTGNGPFSFDGNSTNLVRNPYSWTHLGNVLYVDQPVGTGLSTASVPYPVKDNGRVTTDFAAWLIGFFERFPHLQSKKIHLMGESYAGIYIPYFANQLLKSNISVPLNIVSMSLGDGSWGNGAAMSSVAMGQYIKSQAPLLGIPQDVLDVFSEADEACGFNGVLAKSAIYPPQGIIDIPGNPEYFNLKHRRRDLIDALNSTCDIGPSTPEQVRTSIFNSSCYGPCATFSTAMDYMTALSESSRTHGCYDVYDISHDCTSVSALPLLGEYFSRPDVQTALHVSDSGNYMACNSSILATLLAAASPVPPEYTILPSLINEHNISLHLYSGEWDMLINHLGAELSLQNMTWRGAQGFSNKPTQLWYANDAAPSKTKKPKSFTHATTLATAAATASAAGTWGEERGVSYHLFYKAGHSVFINKPREMFSYVRDVVVAPKAG
jgi:carboxypeptidase C (cathepsin A)